MNKSNTIRAVVDDPGFLRSCDEISRHFDVPQRPLQLQSLLELPRLAAETGELSRSRAIKIMCQTAGKIPRRSEWIVAGYPLLDDLLFEVIDQQLAASICERFHYLKSARVGRAYGLRVPGKVPIALAVSSEVDVPHLISALEMAGHTYTHTRVISRIFAFEDCPKNAISKLLSNVAAAERHWDVTTLVTYVNPNLGFSGVSYRASGWTVLGSEPTQYRYLGNYFITERQLKDRLAKVPNDSRRVRVSSMPLKPLIVYWRACA
jgi:hypothetical protein